MHFEDLDFPGDRVADEHGIGELPARFEKHRPRTWQIHRDDGVQQAAGQAALDDQLAEPRGRGERRVNVKRVEIARDLTVETDVLRRERRGPPRLLPHHW